MKKRSKFNLSHYKLLSHNMGFVYPISCYEALPGDTIRQNSSVFLRCAPLVTPVMHPVHIKIHHWFVPTRLLWANPSVEGDNWEDFITGGPNNDNTASPPTSTLPITLGSLGDYLGLPVPDSGVTPTLSYSTLPHRAYSLIYNEWYRDEDLEPKIEFPLSGGDDTFVYPLKSACWGDDYFTTARPWPQKGPSINVPITAPDGQTFLNVRGINENGEPSRYWRPNIDVENDSGTFTDRGLLQVEVNSTSPEFAQLETGASFTQETSPAGAYLDLGAATNVFAPNSLVATIDGSDFPLGEVNINDLREAFALQRFGEHRALYGSRYVEYLRYLGVRASDARLQRPEYLSGSKQTIQFSEVLQTAEGSDPVGTLRGHGIATGRSNSFQRFFEEHGFIVTILEVMPLPVYMQGTDRMFLRRIKEDYFQPELQHIGQQEVLTSEIVGNSAASDLTTVFGYQNRYDEYRSLRNGVSGEFRTILDYWHMARSFSSPPVLNADFIDGAPTTRNFASTDTDQFYTMVSNNIACRRLLSHTGNPI